jgi:hypothetical protein
MSTLAQLLTPDTAATIRARLVANLIAAGFPTSSWAPSAAGGPENALLDSISGMMANYAGTLASTLAAMQLLDFSTGDLLTFYALTRYQLQRDPATKTKISLRLTSTAEAPPYQITAGDFWFAAPSGNRYVSTTGGQLESGGTLFIEAEAEAAGSGYADPDRSINSTTSAGAMITPLPGVDVLNVPALDVTPPKLIGYSPGTVTAVFTTPGVAPAYATLRIIVQAIGGVGSGLWQWSTDGGQTWNTGGPFVASVDLAGITIGFQNAPGIANSFLLGDVYSMQIATSTIAQGDDEESDTALRARCRSRWPSLSDVPTTNKISLWAHAASAEVGQLLADGDITKPGQVNVIIAGDQGPVGARTAATVQDYIAPRLRGYQGIGIAETVLVAPATPRQVSASGNVTVPRKTLLAVQQTALANWLAYLRGVRIGGIVRLSELITAIMDAGAFDTDFVAFIGIGGPNLQLAPLELAVPPTDGSSILTTLAWIPV